MMHMMQMESILPQADGDEWAAVEASGILLTFVFDTTCSMTQPIRATSGVATSIVRFVESFVASRFVSHDTKIFVAIVGANDWTDAFGRGDTSKLTATAPVDVFVNVEECVRHKRLVPVEVNADNLQASIAEIDAAIQRMSTTCHGGGDAPEEYATALDFVADYVQTSSACTSFVLVVTDDAQHGMSHHDDMFPQGVFQHDLDKLNGADTAWTRAFAPEGKWAPRNLSTSIQRLMKSSMVVWVTCGNSADCAEDYATWTGVLSTLFEKHTGVLLAWQSGRESSVKNAVISMLCSYIAGVVVTGEAAVDDAAVELMRNAVSNDPSLHDLCGDSESAAAALANLVIVADVDDETRALVADASSDAEAAVLYRSLAGVCLDAISNASPKRSSYMADDDGGSVYQSLGCLDDADDTPVYRSLGAAPAETRAEKAKISVCSMPDSSRILSKISSIRRTA